jgi:hypothetical protein
MYRLGCLTIRRCHCDDVFKNYNSLSIGNRDCPMPTTNPLQSALIKTKAKPEPGHRTSLGVLTNLLRQSRPRVGPWLPRDQGVH